MVIIKAKRLVEDYGVYTGALYLRSYGFSVETTLFVLTGKAV